MAETADSGSVAASGSVLCACLGQVRYDFQYMFPLYFKFMEAFRFSIGTGKSIKISRKLRVSTVSAYRKQANFAPDKLIYQRIKNKQGHGNHHDGKRSL